MSQQAAIKQSLREMMKGLVRDPSLVGIVESVDKAKMIANVRIEKDGLILYGVRLRALPNGEDQGIVCIPKVGSVVVVGMLEGSENMGAVLQYSEVDEVSVKIGDSELVVDDTGISMSRDGEDLLSLMQDLAGKVADVSSEVAKLTVTCAAPGSPSSPPVNLANFTTFSAELNSIKTRFNTLLNG